MAKPVKKGKPAAKPAAKSTSKKPAKTLKQQAKTVLDKIKKAVVAKPAAPAKSNGKKTVPEKPLKAKKNGAGAASTKGKAGKADAKKGKRGGEFEDDDLMVSDEELGAEEIPDLSEFEEEEVSLEIEVTEESGEASVEAKSSDPEEAVLTDAEGRPYCKVKDCDQIAAVDTYCRYHYLLLWKKIQVRRKILVDGKLERYVDELTSRYPDKFLEMIRRDLRTEKDFLSAIAELEIDESGLDDEFEDESQVLDEVRGFGGGEATISDEDGDF